MAHNYTNYGSLLFLRPLTEKKWDENSRKKGKISTLPEFQAARCVLCVRLHCVHRLEPGFGLVCEKKPIRTSRIKVGSI